VRSVSFARAEDLKLGASWSTGVDVEAAGLSAIDLGVESAGLSDRGGRGRNEGERGRVARVVRIVVARGSFRGSTAGSLDLNLSGLAPPPPRWCPEKADAEARGGRGRSGGINRRFRARATIHGGEPAKMGRRLSPREITMRGLIGISQSSL